ncbi:hypothetical protein DB346_04245 [Verrucomicrobia bacterium LW23]|nr:hypothetical protein DB346_04245 [Verrucomicrobia bacterium LW23]
MKTFSTSVRVRPTLWGLAAALIVTCILLLATATPGAAQEKEHWSLTFLKEAFIKDKIMTDKELPLMIYDVEKKKEYTDVEVRINNAKAGKGDPGVAPLLGMFRVYQDKKILWYSIEDDEYQPWPVYVKRYAER